MYVETGERAAGNGLVVEPKYTIGGLFECGKLSLEHETALEEIRTIKDGFEKYVSPGKGWLSPRFSDNRPPIPRQLGIPDIWQRYGSWRKRWGALVLQPSPSLPWGLTYAGLAVNLATSPMTFEEAAHLLGWRPITVVEVFVRLLEDYGRGAGEAFAPVYYGKRQKARDGKGQTPRHSGVKGGKRGG
jgi:hypothetical protein